MVGLVPRRGRCRPAQPPCGLCKKCLGRVGLQMPELHSIGTRDFPVIYLEADGAALVPVNRSGVQ